ncbi:PEP/pyruvate-binding domain-containing protein [Micromonospora parathelypteridis]|uniref:Pyruvate,water dikinase n=1 Tax=Micromonospora parathelypteridis TaxID=1839617 RepID=A0A840VS99_9ACTN|nr:PEP/pyruvate-binding domain-containing protein [Micromonospora parathelypteridis]MBB5480123.1 pyruvate,water dikinase [Micromonospora parathelypteridis]GGO24849.1 putative phosphoenolpyruvate synthase [Micromonospora parathelypteridis]
MHVIALSEATADMVDLVGGKAAGLGELIRRGERVPEGFCVTTEAHRLGVIPTAEVVAAYERLGAGLVAVRSSATAEDLPEASFAGQQDTILNVTGTEELIAAIGKCWASLHTDRATAYRDAHQIDHRVVRMAVVVQRMITPTVAGVLFTANPLTGRRDEMAVDAAAGLGAIVVDGAATVDHYVLDDVTRDDTGCLTSAHLADLRETGARLQAHFGCPQDVEWAIDADGVRWLLQSRPITSLFPLPPDTGKPLPRVYLEFGHVQGMLQPVTPMGMSTLRTQIAAMLAALGVRVEIVDIGGRLYGDLTDLARDPSARKRLVKLLAVDFGPRAQAVMQHVLADPRFAPTRGGTGRGGGHGAASLRTAGRAVVGVVRALARPDTARIRMFEAIEQMRVRSAAPADLRSAADRLRFVQARDTDDSADAIMWPIVAGMLAAALPTSLLKGVATPDEIHTVLGGMPHNVTIDMDLALWRLAQGAQDHRQLLLDTPPAELAARYLRGTLPDIGMAAFLDVYGHRGAAEVDLGVPRWEEDPAPVFAAVANYLRVTDPQQGPDQRFQRAATAAEAALAELVARARRRRPVRGRVAGFLLRRARSLAGLREAGKFAGLYPLRETRRQLLLIGADLHGTGLLDQPDDIMFLTLDEVHAAVHQEVDPRGTVASRREVHRRELRRRTVPVALLSDGTDVETVLPAVSTGDGTLTGVGASAGRVTGPARVVHDPATARVEPGDVLVTATTDPGWTPLFLTAAALVTETGAIMAHGPTVAREYGIPAVICVPDATRTISTGQLITVDGGAGTITIH